MPIKSNTAKPTPKAVAARKPVSKAAPAASPAAKSTPVASKPPVTKPATTKVTVTEKPASRTTPAIKPAAVKPNIAKNPPVAAKPATTTKQAVKGKTAPPLAVAKKATLPVSTARQVIKALAKPANPEKIGKQKKPKLVRDSFTMPEDEYSQIPALKRRLLAQGIAAKKSELLRAGLALLSLQKDVELITQMKKLKPIKMGRPAK